MLTESQWLVRVLHTVGDLLVEELWGEEGDWIYLGALLVGWVVVLQLLSSIRSPLLRSDQVVVKDFPGVDVDQLPVSIVSDSASVVALGDEVLDGIPRNGCLLVPGLIDDLSVLGPTQVVGNEILADAVVGLVE